jgi:hypothetical protein
MKELQIKGPVLNRRNKNGRIYPEGDFKAAAEKFNKKTMEDMVLGQIGHPEGSIVAEDKVSHLIKGVRIKQDRLPRKKKKKMKKEGTYTMWKYMNKSTIIDIEILPTPQGEMLTQILPNSFVSMRSLGKVNQHNSVTNLEIISFDIFPK